jgi:hypothetical protein
MGLTDEITRELKRATDTQMLIASRRMVVLEQLESKSADYVSGFVEGVTHQSDFIVALLTPLIARMNESINELLKTSPR